jgi:hypothetical protein
LVNAGRAIKVYNVNDFSFEQEFKFSNGDEKKYFSLYVDNKNDVCLNARPSLKFDATENLCYLFDNEDGRLVLRSSFYKPPYSLYREAFGTIVRMHPHLFMEVFPNNNGVLFNYSNEECLYHINTNGEIKLIDFDFGEYSTPMDIKLAGLDKVEAYRKQNPYRFVTSYAQFKDQIAMRVFDSKTRHSLFCVLNESTLKADVYEGIFSKKLGCEIKFIGAYDKGFIGVIEFGQYDNTFEKINKKVEMHEKLSNEENELLKICDVESNPIVVLFNLE